MQRLVDDLGTTLLEVIEAPRPLEAEVTGAAIFDVHDDLLISPGELLLGVPGYTFGLGFTVRTSAGIAGLPGSAGEFMWGGAGGTLFWVDPKEELVAVFMSQGPAESRTFYRRLVKQLVYAAIVD